MLYEVAATIVESLERIAHQHLRKWLGIPPSFTSIGLYGKTNKLQFQLSSPVEEFKTATTTLVLTLRDSQFFLSALSTKCYIHMYLVMVYFTYTVFCFVLLLVFGVIAHSLYIFSIAGALECRQMVANGLSIPPVTNLMFDVLTLLPNW